MTSSHALSDALDDLEDGCNTNTEQGGGLGHMTETTCDTSNTENVHTGAS